MDRYTFKATNLIAETFEKYHVKFGVVDHLESEQLLACFPVDCGPTAVMRFISNSNDNDVAVRIFGLISRTPREKRQRLMEACNILNYKIRYTKFYVDSDGDINVEYDFPVHTPDESIGEMAFEIFVRMMKILDGEYGIFMKALYSEDELDIQGDMFSTELTERLQELSRRLEAELADMDGLLEEEDLEEDLEDEDPDLDLDLETADPSDEAAG